MEYKILFTEAALADLEQITEYAWEHYPVEIARKFADSLLDHISLLSNNPRLGACVLEEPEVRRLLQNPIPIYYRLKEQDCVVEITAFRHTSRKPLSEP